MEIEEIKNWQWVLTGLFVGVLFSCFIAWSGPGFDTQSRDTIGQGEFENDTFVLSKIGNLNNVAGQMTQAFERYHKDMPLLRDVTVHPPIASDPTHYWVTGRFYSIGRQPVDPKKPEGPAKDFEEWKLFKFPAVTPYKPGYELREEKKLNVFASARRNAEIAEEKKAFGNQASFPTVVDYLNAVQKIPNANFKFQFAWWEKPIPKWTLPPAAGLLTIGIAWPLVLSGMRNYGLAKPVAMKAKPKPTVAKKPTRPITGAMPAGVVLKQAAPAAPVIPAERVEYGGEFYPVVKSTHKE